MEKKKNWKRANLGEIHKKTDDWNDGEISELEELLEMRECVMTDAKFAEYISDRYGTNRTKQSVQTKIRSMKRKKKEEEKRRD